MNKNYAVAVIMFIIFGSVTFFNMTIDKAFGEGVRGNGLGVPGMVWRLDLTKEQRENITTKENSIEKEILPLKSSIRENRNLLNTELSADKPDLSKVNSLIDSISRDMTSIQKKKMFFMLWMREQLTPEQSQKLLSLLKSRQQTGAGSEETGGY